MLAEVEKKMNQPSQITNQQTEFNPVGIIHGPHKPMMPDEFKKIGQGLNNEEMRDRDADIPRIDRMRFRAHDASQNIHRLTNAEIYYPREVQAVVAHDSITIKQAREHLSTARFQNIMNEDALQEALEGHNIAEGNFRLGMIALGDQWRENKDTYTKALGDIHKEALAHKADETLKASS